LNSVVEITAPARIHIDLIDMCGQLGRINGGVGFAVTEPACRLRISAASHLQILGVDEERRQYVERQIEYAAQQLRIPDSNFRVEVLHSTPRHVGLGSGTQWQLALLALLGGFFGNDRAIADAATLSTRGRTSGIGVHAFRGGGFIVDGGRCIDNLQPAFEPSSSAAPGRLPPLLFHSAFPGAWGVVLFVPQGYAGLSGDEERAFMRRNTPLPKAEVAAVCHSLLMEMMPALLEEDLDTFCQSVSRLQSTGWKARHWARPDLVGLGEIASCLERLGVKGVGLSSTGPTLFGFYCRTMFPDPEELRSRLQEGLHSKAPGDVLVTSGANHGAEMRILSQ
jgi:beta-ribofuranosylaminobenzene 5'-phosphate synthase